MAPRSPKWPSPRAPISACSLCPVTRSTRSCGSPHSTEAPPSSKNPSPRRHLPRRYAKCCKRSRQLRARVEDAPLFPFPDLLTQVAFIADLADLVKLRFQPIDVSFFVLQKTREQLP